MSGYKHTVRFIDANGTEQIVAEYEGFRAYRPGDQILCVAVFDGDNDLWALDPDVGTMTSLAQLDQYYRADYERGASGYYVHKLVLGWPGGLPIVIAPRDGAS